MCYELINFDFIHIFIALYEIVKVPLCLSPDGCFSRQVMQDNEIDLTAQTLLFMITIVIFGFSYLLLPMDFIHTTKTIVFTNCSTSHTSSVATFPEKVAQNSVQEFKHAPSLSVDVKQRSNPVYISGVNINNCFGLCCDDIDFETQGGKNKNKNRGDNKRDVYAHKKKGKIDVDDEEEDVCVYKKPSACKNKSDRVNVDIVSSKKSKSIGDSIVVASFTGYKDQKEKRIRKEDLFWFKDGETRLFSEHTNTWRNVKLSKWLKDIKHSDVMGIVGSMLKRKPKFRTSSDAVKHNELVRQCAHIKKNVMCMPELDDESKDAIRDLMIQIYDTQVDVVVESKVYGALPPSMPPFVYNPNINHNDFREEHFRDKETRGGIVPALLIRNGSPNFIYNVVEKLDKKCYMLTEKKIKSIIKTLQNNSVNDDEIYATFASKCLLIKELDKLTTAHSWFIPYLNPQILFYQTTNESKLLDLFKDVVQQIRRTLLEHVSFLLGREKLSHKEKVDLRKSRIEAFKEYMRMPEYQSMFAAGFSKGTICQLIYDRHYANINKETLSHTHNWRTYEKIKNSKCADRNKARDIKYYSDIQVESGAHAVSFDNVANYIYMISVVSLVSMIVGEICGFLNLFGLRKIRIAINQFIDSIRNIECAFNNSLHTVEERIVTAINGIENQVEEKAKAIANEVNALSSVKDFVQHVTDALVNDNDVNLKAEYKVILIEFKTIIHASFKAYAGDFVGAFEWLSNFACTRPEMIKKSFMALSKLVKGSSVGFVYKGKRIQVPANMVAEIVKYCSTNTDASVQELNNLVNENSFRPHSAFSDMSEFLTSLVSRLSFSNMGIPAAKDIAIANSYFALCNNVTKSCKGVIPIIQSVISYIGRVFFSYDPFNEEYNSFLTKITVSMSDMSLCLSQATNMPGDAVLVQNIIDVYVRSTEHLSNPNMLMIPSFISKRFMSVYKDYEHLYRMALATQKGIKGRCEPVTLLMCGPPGVGKSSLSNYLQQIISKIYYKKPYNELMTYSYNSDSEYWEGYAYQPFVLMDDLFSASILQECRSESKTILNSVNTAPFKLNMAFGSKGQIYFNSDFILATTNKANDGWESVSLTDVGNIDGRALKRRFNIVIHSNDEFKEPYDINAKKWKVEQCIAYPEYNDKVISSGQLAYLMVLCSIKLKEMQSSQQLSESAVQGIIDNIDTSIFKVDLSNYAFKTHLESDGKWFEPARKYGLKVESGKSEAINLDEETKDTDYSSIAKVRDMLKQTSEMYRETGETNPTVMKNGLEFSLFYDDFREEINSKKFEKEIISLILDQNVDIRSLSDTYEERCVNFDKLEPVERIKTWKDYTVEALYMFGLIIVISTLCVSAVYLVDMFFGGGNVFSHNSEDDITIDIGSKDIQKHSASKRVMKQVREKHAINKAKQSGNLMVFKGSGMFVVPESTSAHIENIQNKLFAGACHFEIKDSRGNLIDNCVGFHVRDGYVAVPAHWFNSIRSENSSKIHVINKNVRTVIDVPDVYCMMENVDLVVFKMPNSWNKPCKMIDYFVDEESAPIISDGSAVHIIAPSNNHGFNIKNANIVHVNEGCSYRADGERFIVATPHWYTNCTKPGDSGALVTTCDVNGKMTILGMHLGTATTKNLSMAMPITKRFIDRYIVAIDNLNAPSTNSTEQIFTIHSGKPQFPKEILEIVPASQAVVIPGKSKLKRSPFYGWQGEPDCIPARLHDFVSPDGEYICPLYKGIAKMSQDDVPVTDIPDSVIDWLHKLYPGDDFNFKTILDFDDVINGKTLDVEKHLSYTSICHSTSAGYPWNKTAIKGKSPYINLTSNQTFEYDETFLQYVKDCDNKIRNGSDIEVIWADTLKDETRPREKVNQGKTRVFSTCPVHYLVLMRRYFLMFVTYVQSKCVLRPVSVGINPHSNEWDMLYWRFSKWKTIIAGDFENWDGHVSKQAGEKFLQFVNEWYNDGDENATARKMLCKHIWNAVHLCEDKKFVTSRGNPSGNPITSIYNSFCQIIMMYTILINDYNLDEDQFDLAVYGDDNIIGTNVENLTCADLAVHLKRRFHINYTHWSKDGNNYSDTLDSIRYLGRKFLKCPDGGRYRRAPLEDRCIYEILYWVRKSETQRETFKNTILSFLIELSHTGKDNYNRVIKILREQFAKWQNDPHIDPDVLDAIVKFKHQYKTFQYFHDGMYHPLKKKEFNYF